MSKVARHKNKSTDYKILEGSKCKAAISSSSSGHGVRTGVPGVSDTGDSGNEEHG
jgi:hypothetical protein